MAKPTKGEKKIAEQTDAVEDVVQNEVVEKNEEASVEDAEIVDHVDDGSDETPTDDNAPEVELETTEIASETPGAPREIVVERKGGFFPMLLGGVLAAGVGVASAEYIFPNGLPFGAAATQKVDLESALKLQEGRIDDLKALLESQPEVDAAAIDAAVSAVGDLQAQIGALVDNVDAIETRVATLEKRPSGDGSGVSVALEQELADLRAALDVQKGALANMLAEAQETKQSAEETARQTMARAAMTRILVALESGAAFDDALADVEANTDIALPEVLAKAAADGVPTLADLSANYPEAARAALAAVRSEDTGGGVGGFFAKQLGVRSVAPREGDDPDAVLSRIEAAVNEGRIADALALSDALPDAAKAPLADWMSQANLRLSAAREAEALANSLNSQ